MLNGTLAETGVILGLVVINGFLSLSEMAIVSARKTRLREMAEKGHGGAKAAIALASAPSASLASLRVGITMVGVLAGVFAGATLSGGLADSLRAIPVLAPWANAVGLGAVVAFVTFLMLIVGEVIPKRLALSHAEAVASRVALPLQGLVVAAAPVVRLLGAATDTVARALRMDAKLPQAVTEEEVKILVDQGKEAGVFEEIEGAIIKKAMRLGDLTVADLMTPRVKMVGFNISDSVDENMRKIAEHPHHHFPVYDGSPDDIKGVISVKLLFRHLSLSRRISFADCLVEPLYLPESMTAVRALEEFRRSAHHVALVVDEHGGTAGILTLSDFMDAIVGDMTTGPTPEERKVQRRDDGAWVMDGLLIIHELVDSLGIDGAGDEDDHANYQSLGGFVMSKLGQIPSTGDHFTWRGFRFEVMAMEGHRVDKVLVWKEVG